MGIGFSAERNIKQRPIGDLQLEIWDLRHEYCVQRFDLRLPDKC